MEQAELDSVVGSMLALERLHDADVAIRCAEDIVYAFFVEYGQGVRAPVMRALRELLAAKYASELEGNQQFARLFAGCCEPGLAQRNTAPEARILQTLLFVTGLLWEPAVREWAGQRCDPGDLARWIARMRPEAGGGPFEDLLNGGLSVPEFCDKAVLMYCALKPGDALGRPGRSEESRAGAAARVLATTRPSR